MMGPHALTRVYIVFRPPAPAGGPLKAVEFCFERCLDMIFA